MPTTRRRVPYAKHRPLRAPSRAPDDQVDNVTRAYEALRPVIVSGQLPPGSRVSERVLAERLGLSRTPVRSALHRLEQEGFVSSSGAGRERRLIVAPLTVDDGREVMSLVGHLEGMAARAAALLPLAQRRAIVKNLRDINAELAAESPNAGNSERFFALDNAFHLGYVDGVVGPRLLAMHRALKPQGERYLRLYVSVLLDEVKTSVKEHEKIAASIAKGDADAAQSAAEANWRNAAERLAQVISRQGERGNWHSAVPEVVASRKR